MTAHSVTTGARAADLRHRLFEGLAEARACSTDEIQEMAGNGPVRVTAKEALSIAAKFEEELELGEVVTPDDFGTDVTRRPSASGASPKSPRGCLESAEDVTLDRIFDVFATKMGLTAA